MRNLWALLMLVVIASGIFALNPSVFAQQSSEQSVNDDMMVGGSASSNSTEDDAETTGDDATTDDSETTQDDTSSETTDEPEENTETDVDSPREQLMKGVDPHQIQCDTGLKMAFRANTFQPVCLKEATYQILSQRGWVSSVDPTPEELSSMLSTLPADKEMINDSVDDSAMEEDSTQDSDTNDTETDDSDVSTDDASATEPTPQSHQVNLSESMAMATN